MEASCILLSIFSPPFYNHHSPGETEIDGVRVSKATGVGLQLVALLTSGQVRRDKMIHDHVISPPRTVTSHFVLASNLASLLSKKAKDDQSKASTVIGTEESHSRDLATKPFPLFSLPLSLSNSMPHYRTVKCQSPFHEPSTKSLSPLGA